MKKLLLALLVLVVVFGCSIKKKNEAVEAEVADPVVLVAPEIVPAPEPIVEPLPPIQWQDCEEGFASWYGPGYYGNRTANGERYWGNEMTAAHQTLPFDTVVDVCRIDKRDGPHVGICTEVRINDRGPFINKRSEGGPRIIDLSTEAAKDFEMVQAGVALVRICWDVE